MQISKFRLITIILGLILAVVLSRNILTLVSVEDRIDDLRQKIVKEEGKKKELLRLREDVSSPFFIEKEAREKLGLAKEGETVVVLPSEDYLRSLITPLDEEDVPINKSNWKKWLKLFF